MALSSAALRPDVVGFFDPATHTVTYLVSDRYRRRCSH